MVAKFEILTLYRLYDLKRHLRTNVHKDVQIEPINIHEEDSDSDLMKTNNQCDFCDKVFNRLYDLKRHLRANVHKEDVQIEPIIHEDSDSDDADIEPNLNVIVKCETEDDSDD